MIILLVGYTFLLCLMVHQLVIAHERYRFELRSTHGKRRVYVRSRKTGRVIMQTRNLFDLLSLGV